MMWIGLMKRCGSGCSSTTEGTPFFRDDHGQFEMGGYRVDEQEIRTCAQVARADSIYQKRIWERLWYRTWTGRCKAFRTETADISCKGAFEETVHSDSEWLHQCVGCRDRGSSIKGLRENIASTTVLLISQRISTVMKTDRILCMEEWGSKGFGTHEELMQDCVL